MTTTFGQHELEIIKGYQDILITTDRETIQEDMEKMIGLLEGEDGYRFIKDETERFYVLQCYHSTYNKIRQMTDNEFQDIDFSFLELFD